MSVRIILLYLLAAAIITAALPCVAAEICITDDSGYTVTLEDRPKTSAVLFSSLTDIWLDAGGDVAVTVGESIVRGLVDENTPVVDSGAGKSIDLELLIASGADFVVASADVPAQVEAAGILRMNGIPCVLFREDSYPQYLSVFKRLCDVTGNQEAYETLGERQRIRVEKTIADMPAHGTRVVFLRAGAISNSLRIRGSDENFVCAMLRELGCVNLADDSVLPSSGMNLECILLYDPDILFFSIMGDEEAGRLYIDDLLKQDVWSSLRAVRENRAYVLPRELFHFKPNSRWAQAYDYLASLIQEAGAQ